MNDLHAKADRVTKVLQVYFSQRFTDSYPVYDALGEIITEAREHHQKAFPLSQPITRFGFHIANTFSAQLNNRQNVTIYAHESSQKAMCIPDGLTTSGTVLDFFLHFVKQGWTPPSAADKRSVEIRLACSPQNLVCHGLGEPHIVANDILLLG